MHAIALNSIIYVLLSRGSRGVDAIMKGAFQRVSAHIAVDAIGGELTL